MSAGAFLQGRYQRNNGDIHPIRIQPETVIGTFNPLPGGAATSDVSARANGSRRGLGINARKVNFFFSASAPAGYKAGSIISLPVLTPTAWDAINKGATFTYLGGTCTVVGKSPEYVN